MTALLDQRDKLLGDLRQYGDIATSLSADGSVHRHTRQRCRRCARRLRW